jgi:predicted DNA repair protein MutK
MPAASLLTLIDDIASVLDDVAAMTKIAAKKTAGVLGDDLALNAQQVHGVKADRELPVVWAVAKGSALNKAILVPAALGISALAPWAVTPLLMAGGAYLCFEGFEKLAHKFMHGPDEDEAHHAEHVRHLADPAVDVVALEREKIKAAIRTDFILSAEIITIALGVVAGAPFATRVTVLAGIAALMTIGVYGLVAGIVKLDDAGLYLQRAGKPGAVSRLKRGLGTAILRASPVLMKGLSIAGTAAMFLVGGGILAHGVPAIHHFIEALAARAGALPGVGPLLAGLTGAVLNGLVGVLAGALALGVVALVKRVLRGAGSPPASSRGPGGAHPRPQ